MRLNRFHNGLVKLFVAARDRVFRLWRNPMFPVCLLIGLAILWTTREPLLRYFSEKNRPPLRPYDQLLLESAFPALPVFDRPIAIENPPDGTDRLFIVEQTGRVFWVHNSTETTKANLALDIRERVLDELGTGVFGFVFHPRAAESRRIYVHYASARHRGPVISEFLIDKRLETIEKTSERILLELPQNQDELSGGGLEFGPDGFLYISIGQLSEGDDAQNPGNLIGKILRIDVDSAREGHAYSIPRDNPFAGETGARGEIWAFGFRNVWRFSFDRNSQLLFAGDIGTDWEEVNLVVKGGNYGWNYYDGFKLKKRTSNEIAFNPPVLAHNWGRLSAIIGGYVYRGAKLPFLQGSYIYGDYGTGDLFSAVQHEGAWKARRFMRIPVYGEKFAPVDALAKHLTTFGEDRNGEVYIATEEGDIFKLDAVP